MVTTASELINDKKIGGSLCCSDHALVEFMVLRDKGQVKSNVKTPNFRKANFQPLKQLVSMTSWETALRDRGEQSWQSFNDAFHRAQKLSVPRCEKSAKGREETRTAESRPAGQTKEQEGTARAVEAKTGILGRLQGHCVVEQGWCHEDQGAVGAELVRGADNSKKGFYRYVSQNRKAKESLPSKMEGPQDGDCGGAKSHPL